MNKILYIGPDTEKHAEIMQKNANIRMCVSTMTSDANFDRMEGAVEAAEAIILAGDALPPRVASMAVNLKLLQLLGCSYRGLDRAVLADQGVTIASASPVLAPVVAQHAVALMQAICKQVAHTKSHADGDRLEGKSVGIIGLGRVGINVARLLVDSPVNVIYCDIRTARQGLATDLGVRRHTLDRLLTICDVVTIHASYGPTAAPLLEQRELRLMSGESVLINTADPRIVDQGALATALIQGTIGGAALDSIDLDSQASAKLIAGTRSAIIASRIAGSRKSTDLHAIRFGISNVAKFLDNQPITGELVEIDWPRAGDPAFWSSEMAPRKTD